MVVAIDFTGSNGDPNLPDSLHYIDPLVDTKGFQKLNPYQQAITSVGRVLGPYDSDQQYPVYGFGARLRGPDGRPGVVSHCFPVYGGGVEVHGVEGILKAYVDCLKNVTLSGPTLFGPLIRAATQIAQASSCTQEKQQYTILMILTDGVINDFDQTIAAIIDASQQPMSIIIIGVGSADFSDMKKLDSDGQMLRQAGKVAARDIVQFVSYNELIKKGISALAEGVLAEIPGQLLDYMKFNNIKPLPPAARVAHQPSAT